MSDGALWLIEGIGCHLATVVKAEIPSAHWAVWKVPSHYNDVDRNRTKLCGLPGGRAIDPSRMVYSEMISTQIHGEPVRDESLEELYAFAVGDTPR